MKVEWSRISKGNICPYLGREIPNWEALGLDPAKTYRLFRDPAELEKGASTFDGKPLLIRHMPVDAVETHRELWVGSLGQCTFEAPYLITRPLTVWTQEAIDLIESEEQRELSAGYRYDALMEPGTWGGQVYDGRMVNIRGNHVAIVREGRAGPDVHVADELPLELRTMTAAEAVARALKPYLGSDPKTKCIAIALDSMLGEVPAESVTGLDDAEMKKACDEALAEKRKEHGEDAELDDEEKEEAYKRARDKKAKDKKAAKDKKHGKDAKHGKDSKEGEDALPNPNDHRDDFRAGDSVTKDEMNAAVKAAVDAERARAKAAMQAREQVRPLVGVVSVAMDSADEIYRFALKHAGVKTDGVHESALAPLVEMAVKQKQTPTRGAPLTMDASTAQLLDIKAIFGPQPKA